MFSTSRFLEEHGDDEASELLDNATFEVFVRDWWRIERGVRVPNPGAEREILDTGLSLDEARELCREWNDSHEPGELSRKAEFTKE